MKSISPTPESIHQLALSLGRSTLFRGMDQALLRDIAGKATLVQAGPDEFMAHEGEPSSAFFVLLNGHASVLVGQADRKDEVEIAQLGPGDAVGDVALLLSQPYAASVKAVDTVVAARYETRFFNQMAETVPAFGMMLARAIGGRLQQVLQLIPMPEYTPAEGEPEEEAFKLLPVEFMKRHRLLPLKKDANVLTLGFVGAPSGAVVQSIRTLIPGIELHPVRMDSTLFESMMRERSGARASAQPAAGPGRPEAATAAPAIDRLLQSMIAEGASDLHLSAGQRPRWRIDGQMREISDAPALERETAFEMLKPLIDERYRQQFQETNDVDFAYALAQGGRFRVNLFRDSQGASAVFRNIPYKIPSREQLGMPEVISRFCAEPKGLILVTGPTGSGKSTTLAAMVDLINRTRKEHILTLEDPVEFVHPSREALINQREIGSHTQSFARALRAALREDPDIVLVGEMRDLETVSLAMETANTGHLVLATLHTSTAALTVDRIVSFFPPEQQNQTRSTLADVLRGVVCQNLCRRIGGGRVAALEVLVVNPAVSALIREGKTVQIQNIMQTGKALGNQLLNESLASLVQARKVEYEEALSKAVDKTDLAKRLHKTG